MASKWVISLFCIIILSSCSNFFSWDPSPEKENELRIVNNTNDTLIIGISAILYDGSYTFRDMVELYPHENFRYGGMLNASLTELLNGFSWDERDTMKIYKAVCESCGGKLIHDRGGNLNLFMGEICYVKWGGPVVTLPESFHSFYNTNSWVLKTEGKKKNKRTIATFTITEDDLK